MHDQQKRREQRQISLFQSICDERLIKFEWRNRLGMTWMNKKLVNVVASSDDSTSHVVAEWYCVCDSRRTNEHIASRDTLLVRRSSVALKIHNATAVWYDDNDEVTFPRISGSLTTSSRSIVNNATRQPSGEQFIRHRPTTINCVIKPPRV